MPFSAPVRLCLVFPESLPRFCVVEPFSRETQPLANSIVSHEHLYVTTHPGIVAADSRDGTGRGGEGEDGMGRRGEG